MFVVRYRRAQTGRATPTAPQIHGANRLELAWTIAPVVILFAIAAFVFAKLPGHPGRPRCRGRRGEPRRRGDRHAVHVGVPLPERRRRDRPAARARRAHRRARRDRARLGRHPLLVDPGARRQDRRDPRHGSTRRGSRRSAPGCSSASAPSSAGSTTRRCSRRWRCCRRRSSTRGSRERETQQAAGTSPLGEELWEGACAKCHGLDGEGGYGPRDRRDARSSRTPRRSRSSSATGRGDDAAGRPRLERRAR